MTGPLTYPPEIVIESKIDLPPGYEPPVDNGKWMSAEVCFELVVFAIELVAASSTICNQRRRARGVSTKVLASTCPVGRTNQIGVTTILVAPSL